MSILTNQGRFTFAIDRIPVRFSRNDPDSLPDRKLIPSEEGFEQMKLFEDESRYANLRWFLVIDTPYNQPVEHAFLVGYTEYNETVCKWEIPLTDTVPVMSDIKLDKPQAVKVPPAKAKLKLVAKKEERKD